MQDRRPDKAGHGHPATFSNGGRRCNPPRQRTKCCLARLARKARELLELPIAVNASTVQPILALLGHPVAGNPTQYMIEQVLLHHGLDWRFLSLEVPAEYLPDAIRGMRAMGFRGGACTDPHKNSVIQFLDRSNPVAEITRVVNCFYQEDRHLIGENTEGRGFLQALRRRTDPAGKRVVILGAGRMARAIGVELALARASSTAIARAIRPAPRITTRLPAGSSRRLSA
jgi:shikimate 5-dehydrogenase